MDNKENENASVPENNTGKSSKKLSKKEKDLYMKLKELDEKESIFDQFKKSFKR